MDYTYIDSYKKLGLNISYYRNERGISQLKLSELLDIDRTHMGNIEKAKSGVSLDILFKLAEIFNISVYKFFEFRG